MNRRTTRRVESLHGHTGFGFIDIAEIDSIEFTVIPNLEKMEPGHSLAQPGFIEIVPGKIRRLEHPVRAGNPSNYGRLFQHFHIGNENAHRQLRLTHITLFVCMFEAFLPLYPKGGGKYLFSYNQSLLD